MTESEDVLFSVRNALHLGAPQTAISEATHLTGLTNHDKIMKDVLTHRAYIELGSSEVRRRGFVVDDLVRPCSSFRFYR